MGKKFVLFFATKVENIYHLEINSVELETLRNYASLPTHPDRGTLAPLVSLSISSVSCKILDPSNREDFYLLNSFLACTSIFCAASWHDIISLIHSVRFLRMSPNGASFLGSNVQYVKPLSLVVFVNHPYIDSSRISNIVLVSYYLFVL